MKLHAERSDDVQVVTGYGPGWVAIDKQEHRTSLLLSSQGLLQDWNCPNFAALTPAHFEALAAHDVELVLFGSGRQLRFVPPAWLRPLMEKRIGLETMDSQAACRTYNVLAMEGRKVLAALVLE